jgi:hypothetical protein
MQHHAADQLHVEMALLERALGGFAHRREGGRGEIVERLAGGQLGAELFGLGAQLLVAERGEFGLERVDRRRYWVDSPSAAVRSTSRIPFLAHCRAFQTSPTVDRLRPDFKEPKQGRSVDARRPNGPKPSQPR